MPGQVKVGVGLYILNNRNQLLLGLRRGAHMANLIHSKFLQL